MTSWDIQSLLAAGNQVLMLSMPCINRINAALYLRFLQRTLAFIVTHIVNDDA